MKYAILTFGCRTNQADSFALERELRGQGGCETGIESADLVIVNTCAVTAMAEQAARQAIRRVARANPTARIVATGCYATRDSAALSSLPIVRVIPNEAKGALVSGEGVGVPQDAGRAIVAPIPPPGTGGRTVHLLRVQTGCNEECTYCIVPATRGPSQSRPICDVIAEVRAAAAAGFRQATVTGVHLGCYGRDLRPSTTLAGLVRRLSVETADVMFRLSAVEPMDVDDDLLEAAARSGRVVPHFHLPLQHASDSVLRAMGRPYTLDAYQRAVEKLRAALPDAAIGTDVIAGFPGETEEEFNACSAYLAASGLAYLHVFPFSPRPGTPASRLAGRPCGDVVRRRVAELRAIGADLGCRFRSRFVGARLDGLTLEDGSLVLTDNYLRVRIPPGLARNERVTVRVVADGAPMRGELA